MVTMKEIMDGQEKEIQRLKKEADERYYKIEALKKDMEKLQREVSNKENDHRQTGDMLRAVEQNIQTIRQIANGDSRPESKIEVLKDLLNQKDPHNNYYPHNRGSF